MDVCTKKSKSCFIAILDGTETPDEKSNKTNSKLQQQIDILEQVKNKFGDRPVQFAWIDGTCQNTVLTSLQMSDYDLPNLIYYSDVKKSYSRIIGRFEYDTLALFAQNTLKN